MMNIDSRRCARCCARTARSPHSFAPGVVAFALAIAAPPAAAQGPALAPRVGFTLAETWTDPSQAWGTPGFATGFVPGELFWPVANELRVIDTASTGTFRVALTLPAGHVFGLVTTQTDALEVFATDFDAAVLHRFDRASGLPSRATTPCPANTFDLAVDPGGEVWVSANPEWPAPQAATGVWLVDPAPGGIRHLEVVRLDGPSGPVVFASNGDLIVARLPQAVPPPPRSVQLLRFGAAQLAARRAGGALLHAVDAIATLGGLDGAYDMVLDDAGRVLISDINVGVIRRTTPDLLGLEPTDFTAGGTDTPLQLEFVDAGPQPFDAFQPARAGALHVCAARYGRQTGIQRLRPQRPTLATDVGPTINPGAATLSLRAMPPTSTASILLSAAPALAQEVAVLTLHARPLWLGLDLLAPISSAGVSTDASGAFDLPFVHVGAAAAFTLTVQAIAIDTTATAGSALVSTPPLQLRLVR